MTNSNQSKFNLRFSHVVIIILLLFIANQIRVNWNSPAPVSKSEKIKEISDSILVVRESERMKNIASFDSLAKAHNLKVKKDEFSGTEFYQHKNVPNHTNANFLYPYLSKKGQNVNLRYRIQYKGADWLFIDKVIFKLQNESKSIEIYQGKFERDNDTSVWEWADMSVSQIMYLNLIEASKAKDIKIRFQGKKYNEDREMTSKELIALKNTLDAYKLVRD